MDWKGRSIDNGSVGSCLIQMTKIAMIMEPPATIAYISRSPFRSRSFTKELKQRQDSFAAAATIYEVLTDQRLGSKYAAGHFYQRPNGACVGIIN